MLCLATALAALSLNGWAAEWDKPVPPQCTMEDGGIYYLYNPGYEKYLDANALQATLSATGSALTFSKAGDDWKIKSGPGYLFADIAYMGTDAEIDGANNAWYFEKQSSGSYFFRPSKSDADYSWESYPDSWAGAVYATGSVSSLTKQEDASIDWYIVAETNYTDFTSKVNLHKVMAELQGYGYDVSALLNVYTTATTAAEFDAAIAGVQNDLTALRIDNASESKPYDVTSIYMTNPSFTENWEKDGHDVPGWTMVPAYFCGMGEVDGATYTFYNDNKTLGSWSGGAFGDNKLYQSLTGLRNGKYRLGNYGIWIRHTGEDGDPIKGAYIYAKVGDKMYKQLLTDTGWWHGLSEVTFECRTGEAEVGIMFEGTNVGQCIIYDFRLEYMGYEPVAARLNSLTTKSQTLIEEGAMYSGYIDKLKADMAQAESLIAAGDNDGMETLFTTFLSDYEAAELNKEKYVEFATLLDNATTTLGKGDSKEMEALSDYIMDNQLEDNLRAYAYDNDKLTEIITTLNDLNDKAANSVIDKGADVTHLLVNGKFDTTGGWTAALGDFGINTSNNTMEKWWGDFIAEQTVTNIANGKYRLEVQGFQWCSWDWAQSESDWVGGDKTPTFNVTSKIRLNNDETTIPNVFACGKTDIQEGYQAAEYFVPNNSDIAVKFFELGLYNNVVETTVSDNTLKVTFDCSKQGFWNCFYNLRLTYLGADIKEAKANLATVVAKADAAAEAIFEGAIRKEIEDAKARAGEMIADDAAEYDAINALVTTINNLIVKAQESAIVYSQLKNALVVAEQTLAVERFAETESGKAIKALYDTTLADYNSEYPSLSSEAAASIAKEIEALAAKAKSEAGVKSGEEITDFIANPSFENTFGNENSVGGAAHDVPYGWTMRIGEKDCKTAQELTDGGINSWTAIEENAYTTDGNYSYCLLSAPVPDCYLYQTVEGLPAGTYKVTVDINVTYDGGCSRLTGQRLLVNNVAQYYGKESNYIAAKLDELHPEEVARTFAGYEEVNSSETGESGDMGNMSTLAVEVTIAKGEALTLGVRTDNNKDAMTCNYDNNYWDCTGRYKLDNFRLYCVTTDEVSVNGIAAEGGKEGGKAFNLMGIEVNPKTAKGMYIMNGKTYIGR